ncbi:hypothetical protein [Neobacillus mesonae]|uniref:hypothetical protein n=1 Tax=Neobacillus mesonae TaxID=1193713 RepID=UPI002042579A|nr:hypothetical protein [Neobacillus mesonae]MCM3570505.1 hypothetical protein [Neobacillus mesonae]
MGTQASFIKFKDMTTTKKELRKYQKRDKSDDVVDIVALEKVKKDIFPFKEGEVVAVVAGERWIQRENKELCKELGLKNIVEVVFVDNPYYWDLAIEENKSIDDILGEHFEKLSDEECKEFLK